MKTLSVILLLFCLNLQAQIFEPEPLNTDLIYTPSFEVPQKTWWTKWGKSAAVFTWQVSSTALNAVGDGLNHNGNKEWGHFCNAAAYAMYMSGPFALNINRKEWAPYLIGCVIARFVFFDPVHNLVIGEDLGYVGNVSYYDKGVQALSAPEHGWLFARAVFLGAKISIDIKYW